MNQGTEPSSRAPAGFAPPPPPAPAGRIHLSVPHVEPESLAMVEEAFRSNWLSSVGPHLGAFEQEVAELLGHGVHALAVSSGTAALHLVLRAIGVGAGDRVAVSSLTFAGSVFPISYLGATPVFLDCDARSATVTPELVEEYLRTARRQNALPKALVAVHLYGQHADIAPIRALCDDAGVVLVEDAAESLGSLYQGRPTATTADYSILSFNGNKIITTTGGGMVVTRSVEALERMRKWATQAREPVPEYLHRELGYNYRMSNVLAGIGRAQLRVLEARVQARREVAARYAAALADLDGVELLPEMPWGLHTRWLSVIRVDPERFDFDPSAVVADFDLWNVEVRPVWRPMHTQPLFAEAPFVPGGSSEALWREGLCLPSSSSLTVAEQEHVIRALRTTLEARAR